LSIRNFVKFHSMSPRASAPVRLYFFRRSRKPLVLRGEAAAGGGVDD
jgi:hypothetical protein